MKIIAVDDEKIAPYGRVKEYKVRGITAESGRKPEFCKRPELYPETKVIWRD